MAFITYIKQLFSKRTATELAIEAVEEHKRMYLQSKAAAEYAAKIASYHEEAAVRLTRYVLTHSQAK